MRLLTTMILAFSVWGYAADEAKPIEIKITAKRFQYDPKEITVQKGQKVRLLVTALDVNHGFAIDAFDIKKKIEADADGPTVIEFTPDKVGEFEYYCVVFCGSGHDGMKGKLIVK